MRTHLFQLTLLVASLAGAAAVASAQEVVHALTGTVTSVNPKGRTFLVNTDDGTEGTFTTTVKPGVKVDFPRNVQAEVVPPGTFTKVNTRILVFYIGDDSVRTAVGLKDLGAGPFVKSTGTVVKLDKHAHTLTLKNASGAEQIFHFDPKTVAEGSEGVVDGNKFEAHKGDSVRVTASSAGGAETALFIRTM